MKHLHLDTFCTPQADRAEHWAAINQFHFGDLDVDEMDVRSVEAQLDVFNLNALKIYRIEAPAHRVSRRHRSQNDLLDDCYKLMLQLRGHARLEISDRRFDLRAGDWSLYDPRTSYSIHNHEPASLLVIKIPHLHLSGLKVPEMHTCAVAKDEGAGLSAMLSSVMQSLSVQLPTLPDDAGYAISESLMSLLTYTLARHQNDVKVRTPLPGILKCRVKQYIHAHLCHPDLDIEQIALAMNCSKRYVHRVFEDEDLTVDRFIWKSRLELVHARLVSERYASHTISQISGTCGFKSNVHLSKLFKKEFGYAPSSLRKGP